MAKYTITVVTNGVDKVYNVDAFGINPFQLRLIYGIPSVWATRISLSLGIPSAWDLRRGFPVRVRVEVINLRKDVSEIFINPKPADLDLLASSIRC